MGAQKKLSFGVYSLLFLVLCTGHAFSQKTVVEGHVLDAQTKETLPFVNVKFQDSKIGTITDINGHFLLETYYATDSLEVSFVGYKKAFYPIVKDESQQITITLSPSSVDLSEFVVVGSKKDENPADVLFKKVLKHKDVNNRVKLDAYEYEVYNKIEFDVNNISKDMAKKRLYRPFEFIFDYIDTTSEGKHFLPMFLTESISKFYYLKNPKSKKEVVKATQISGIQNESVSQFMGDMYQNINVYDNYINIFYKGFISPVSDFGMLTYKYFLTDSAFIGSDWCYKLDFKPKRQHELTFEGVIWVHDTTYAVKILEAELVGNANINWVNHFRISQEYSQVEKEVWMLTKDQLVVDFAVTKGNMGFYGRKTSTYKDFTINKAKELSFFTGSEDIIVEDSTGLRDAEFWEKSRHIELTEDEKNIYQMIDTVKNVPIFRTYIDLIQMFVTGYKVFGPIELGPYSKLFSFNTVEGARFRLGVRTSNDFSTKIMLHASGAHGVKDNKIKYGGGADWHINKNPRLVVGASYAQDIEQLGMSVNAWSQDNIVSSLFRRNPANKLNGFEEYEFHLEKEWIKGFSNEISFSKREIWPLGKLEFNQTNGEHTNPVSGIQTTEVSVFMRFAYKEKFVSGQFERISLGTKYPTFQLRYGYGLKGILDGQYQYHRVGLNISDKIQLNPFGYSEIIVEASKIYGDLPYPLLEIHRGNETYSYDPMAFNLMNFYEFVSDQYASASLTHHFNGLFFNKFPLLRKLKLREVVSAKGVMGSLNNKNRMLLDFPGTLNDLRNKPYYEAGVGIENIFRILRVDAIWRLAYINKEYLDYYHSFPNANNIAKWGIRATLQFQF